MEKISVQKLRKICQVRQGDIINYLYRRISIYITAFLIGTKITANQITGLSILLFLFSSLLLSFGNYYYSILSGLILFLYVLFDCVDGEIARYRRHINQASEDGSGKFCELMAHMIAIPSTITCLTYAVLNNKGNMIFFALGFSGIYFFLLYHVVSFYFKANDPTNSSTKTTTKRYKIIRRLALNIFSTSLLPTIILFLTILNHLWLYLILYGGIFPIFVIIFLVGKMKNFIKLKKKVVEKTERIYEKIGR